MNGVLMKSLQQSSRNAGSRWANDHDRVGRRDLADLRHEMHTGMEGLRSELRGEINELRIEVKSEINELRTELKGEINQLRVEVKADIKGLSDGLNSLREVVAGLAGKVDGLSRSVGLLTKLVMLLMAAAIAAGGGTSSGTVASGTQGNPCWQWSRCRRMATRSEGKGRCDNPAP